MSGPVQPPQENKMGVMPIRRLLLTMSGPMMVSMLIQALYNVVDSMFVSYISEGALTAVSLAYPMQNLMIAVATGTGVGVNALLSRNLGEKNFEMANRAAGNAIFLGVVSFAVFALVGAVGSRLYFTVQVDDPEIIAYGVDYLSVIMVLSVGCFGQVLLSLLLQSTGKTFYSMVIQLVGAGLNIVLDLFPKAKGIIAVEDNKKDAIAKVSDCVKGDARISVAELKTKYPQGAERSLIYATTGRAINSSMLPADAGCIVDNVATIVAVKDAVKEGKPLFQRVVTVTGDAIESPKNLLVRTGTNVSELIEAAGGFKGQPEKVISGGPMMGMAMFTTDVPAVKTFSSLLAFTKDPVSAVEPSNCINCGRCVSVCPQKLMPARLSVLADNNNFEAFEALHGDECVECGCCSFICPAKRNLAQSMKTGRKQVLANRRKK